MTTQWVVLIILFLTLFLACMKIRSLYRPISIWCLSQAGSTNGNHKQQWVLNLMSPNVMVRRNGPWDCETWHHFFVHIMAAGENLMLTVVTFLWLVHPALIWLLILLTCLSYLLSVLPFIPRWLLQILIFCHFHSSSFDCGFFAISFLFLFPRFPRAADVILSLSLWGHVRSCHCTGRLQCAELQSTALHTALHKCAAHGVLIPAHTIALPLHWLLSLSAVDLHSW